MRGRMVKAVKMATRKRTGLFGLLAMLTASITFASEQSVITWEDLAPPQPVIADPFAALSSDQLDALRMILQLESSSDTSLRQSKAEQAADLRRQLSKDGVDADWLFEQRTLIIENRQARSNAVNQDIIGTDIRIPGYVLPLEFEGQKVISFLLVPYAGACIHTPPPPANQMVLVTYPEGIEISGLFTPVWIEGKMNAEYTVQDVGFSDGGSRVEVGYEMSAERVYLY